MKTIYIEYHTANEKTATGTMNSITIKCNAPNDRTLAGQLRSAALHILAEHNADRVILTQEDLQNGSTNRFAYAGGAAHE